MAEVKRMRSPPSAPAPRPRSLARRAATGPIPVWTTRSGPWPCRTRRSRPSGSRTPFISARNASASASMAWASKRRAPLLRTAVSGSSTSSGWRRETTVLSLIVAYRSFGRLRQARHPPRYAAFLTPPSPSFGHSSVYAGGAQVGFAGRIRLNPAVEANPALLRDGTHAVAGSVGGPTTFAPNPAGGPAGFTTLLDRVLDFGLGVQAAAGAPWPAIRTGGLGLDGTLASPFVAPAGLEGYAARIAAAQTGDRAAATEARAQAEGLRGALEEKFGRQSGVDADAEMAAMVGLQNAYAANARVLGTVQAMWDSLLAAVR